MSVCHSYTINEKPKREKTCLFSSMLRPKDTQEASLNETEHPATGDFCSVSWKQAPEKFTLMKRGHVSKTLCCWSTAKHSQPSSLEESQPQNCVCLPKTAFTMELNQGTKCFSILSLFLLFFLSAVICSSRKAWMKHWHFLQTPLHGVWTGCPHKMSVWEQGGQEDLWTIHIREPPGLEFMWQWNIKSNSGDWPCCWFLDLPKKAFHKTNYHLPSTRLIGRSSCTEDAKMMILG